MQDSHSCIIIEASLSGASAVEGISSRLIFGGASLPPGSPIELKVIFEVKL